MKYFIIDIICFKASAIERYVRYTCKKSLFTMNLRTWRIQLCVLERIHLHCRKGKIFFVRIANIALCVAAA